MSKASILGYELDPLKPLHYLVIWSVVLLFLLALSQAFPALAVALSTGILLAVSLAYVL